MDREKGEVSPDQAAVRVAVERNGLVAAGQCWTALAGGQTNRVWRVGQGPGARVCKFFPADRATPLFPNDAAAETRVLQALRGTGLAAGLVGSCRAPGGTCVVYDHVPGETWRGTPRPVAQALARLHALPPPDGLRRLEPGGHAVLKLADDMVAALARPDRERLLQARPDPPSGAAGAPCFLHGDAVPGNILVSADRITLIDWQCPALGDPTEDLAIFLSPAMQRLYRGTPLSAAEEDEFLTGYGCPETVTRYRRLAPVYHWRMAAFCLWKAARGAHGYAEAAQLELDSITS